MPELVGDPSPWTWTPGPATIERVKELSGGAAFRWTLTGAHLSKHIPPVPPPEDGVATGQFVMIRTRRTIWPDPVLDSRGLPR